MVIEFKVVRGWKAIADMVGADSEKTAQKMVTRGLPVKEDDGKVVLSSWDYAIWHQKLPLKQPLKPPLKKSQNYRSRAEDYRSRA